MTLLSAALALAFSGAAGWPENMDGFRRLWRLVPVESPRRGAWESGVLSTDSARVLVRADTVVGGAVRAMDWWAERGPRDVDLPDDAFWDVLDGLSGGLEWTEADPDGLPSGLVDSMEGPAAQGFLCSACDPLLEAATWVDHGSTHLHVARAAKVPAAAFEPGLAAAITGDGIRSLARQKGMGVVLANPCRQGGGDCVLKLSGPKGQEWVFWRASATAPWTSLEASMQAGAWWSPEWNWDSLRIADRREFSGLLMEWLSADADVAARNLLSPVEPVLTFPVSSWFSRRLPGLRFQALADSLSRLSSPPSTVELVRTPRLWATIDAFGRRTIHVGDRP